ncbi:MAG: aminotransferase class I/II-fold pyridoxal phosphate-dependent enzyme [Maribacter sp.]
MQDREENNAIRALSTPDNCVDFSSNDYLGFAKNETIYANTFQLSLKKDISQNGATGSRLLSGNYPLYNEIEEHLAQFHKCESALIFNSGYDANIGIFSAVPQRNDVVFYDEYIHASIRDGIKLGNAKSYKFKHNDFGDLKTRCQAEQTKSNKDTEIYIVTESVFSMDGDSPNLKEFAKFCSMEGFHLIVDEAHALGVFGKKGEGLVHKLGIEKQLFARIVTFGKALGCHGAAILGDKELKSYLVNFARSFVYTTGLPPHSVATTMSAYDYLSTNADNEEIQKLTDNIKYFNSKIETLKLNPFFIKSHSAIHSCLISGNDKVKLVSEKLIDKGFNVKAILSPTVPEGEERLRFCLHSYNTKEEIGLVLQLLKSYL